jgi:hypothetical protein
MTEPRPPAATDSRPPAATESREAVAIEGRPAATEPRRPGLAPDGRTADLALARIHLRLGSLALARAELETMAGRDALDDPGLVDLAEVRWRTGDLTGAGEAADVVLEAGPDRGPAPTVALVIAAEAAAARGRPSEARKLAERAMESAGGSIDAIFAGMPRASVWPADPAAPPPAPTTMFHAPTIGTLTVVRGAGADAASGQAGVAPAAATTPGLWDLGSHRPAPADMTDLPDPTAELDAGRDALARNDVGEAALRLGLTLRLRPSLAPAVLDLVASQPDRALALVRGDAYRLVGREAEARRAFIDAGRVGPAYDAPASKAPPGDAPPRDAPPDESPDDAPPSDARPGDLPPTEPPQGDPA